MDRTDEDRAVVKPYAAYLHKLDIIERAVREGRTDHALEQIHRLRQSIVCTFASLQLLSRCAECDDIANPFIMQAGLCYRHAAEACGWAPDEWQAGRDPSSRPTSRR